MSSRTFVRRKCTYAGNIIGTPQPPEPQPPSGQTKPHRPRSPSWMPPPWAHQPAARGALVPRLLPSADENSHQQASLDRLGFRSGDKPPLVLRPSRWPPLALCGPRQGCNPHAPDPPPGRLICRHPRRETSSPRRPPPPQPGAAAPAPIRTDACLSTAGLNRTDARLSAAGLDAATGASRRPSAQLLRHRASAAAAAPLRDPPCRDGEKGPPPPATARALPSGTRWAAAGEELE